MHCPMKNKCNDDNNSSMQDLAWYEVCMFCNKLETYPGCTQISAGISSSPRALKNDKQ